MAAGDVAVGAGLAGLEVAAFQTLLRPQPSPQTDHVPPYHALSGRTGGSSPRQMYPIWVVSAEARVSGVRLSLRGQHRNAWPATPSGRRSAEESARRATRGAKRRLRPGWRGTPGSFRPRETSRWVPHYAPRKIERVRARPRAGSRAFVVMRDYPRKRTNASSGPGECLGCFRGVRIRLAPFGLTGPACGL
jgi:hypothetical protein